MNRRLKTLVAAAGLAGAALLPLAAAQADSFSLSIGSPGYYHPYPPPPPPAYYGYAQPPVYYYGPRYYGPRYYWAPRGDYDRPYRHGGWRHDDDDDDDHHGRWRGDRD